MKSRGVWSWLLLNPRLALFLARRVDDATGAIQLLPDIAAFDQRANAGRQRRYFIRIQGADETGGDEHHQLGLLRAIGLALEQRSEDRELAQNRYRCRISLPDVVEQAGNRERLTIAQLDVGLGATRRQCRNSEALERHAIREVEGADLGTHFQANEVAGNRRFEVQSNAELFEHDGDGIGAACLYDRYWKLAARQEACFLAVIGNEVRLGEALETAFLLQRADDTANAPFLVKEHQIEEIAEDQAPGLLVVEVRRGKLLRGGATRIPGAVQEQREAELGQGLAIDLGEAHLQHHLLALGAAGHLQHVDDLALRRRRGRDLCSPQHHAGARHVPGEHDRFLADAHRDVFTGEQRLQLLLETGDRRFDHDVV